MGRRLVEKDRIAFQKVISGICGNLAAGWFGLILISPGINQLETIDDWTALLQSLAYGILFLIFAFKLERETS